MGKDLTPIAQMGVPGEAWGLAKGKKDKSVAALFLERKGS